ncbi:MAG TPA: hypothetical protein VKT81_19835 [Bryobacteraceae bacterium]|nr:hypothetical protein [Bryobacteraceae bacterium]
MANRAELEKKLREHPLVAARLRHERDAQAAEATIRDCIYGEPVQISSWLRSSTYQQVKLAFSQITGNRTINDALMQHGVDLLKAFHEYYKQDPVSAATEFRRGLVTEWKSLLRMIYGDSTAETIVLGASKQAKLSIPPGGPLAEDGRSYYGFDSMCHTGFVGPIEQ